MQRYIDSCVIVVNVPLVVPCCTGTELCLSKFLQEDIMLVKLHMRQRRSPWKPDASHRVWIRIDYSTLAPFRDLLLLVVSSPVTPPTLLLLPPLSPLLLSLFLLVRATNHSASSTTFPLPPSPHFFSLPQISSVISLRAPRSLCIVRRSLSFFLASLSRSE